MAFEEQQPFDPASFEHIPVLLGFAWGCDRCTDVCPHNQNPRCTPIKGFYRDIVHKLTLENCRALSKTRAYGWRGAAVLERNLRLCQGEAPVGKE